MAETPGEHGYRPLALTGGGIIAEKLGVRQGFDKLLEDQYSVDDRV